MATAMKIKTLAVALLVLMCAGGGKAQINTDQVIKIGRNALYFEDYVLAIQYFNQVIKTKPFLAEPYFYRSVAKISLDDYQGAEQDATLAIERNPFIVDAYQVRGVARQNQGNFADAVQDYDAGLRLNPEEKIFRVNRAVCESELGHYDQAQSDYDQVLRTDSTNERALLGLAHMNLLRKDTTLALTCLNRCIAAWKNNATAYSMRAMIEAVGQHDYEAAVADMDSTIKLEPSYAGHFINRAYMKYNIDDYFGAMADYDYAISLDPTSIEARFDRGQLRAEVGEYNKAIEDFSFVLSRTPHNFIALYNRAMLYSRTGQLRKAINDFDQVLKEDPQNFVALYGKALLNFQAGQYRDAVTDMTAILKKYPGFEAGYMMRSEAKRRMGDHSGSQADMNRAVAEMKRGGKHVSTFDPMEIESQLQIKKNRQRVLEESEKNALRANADTTQNAEEIMQRFNTLLTVEAHNPVKPEYANRQRGHIQNDNVEVEPMPVFELAYGSHDNKLNGNTYYVKEITDANNTRLLPATLCLVNGTPRQNESENTERFASIEYYNGLLASAQPRSIDYFARGLDQLLVKNPDAAIADAARALALSPDFALAHFLMADAYYMRYRMAQTSRVLDSAPSGQPTTDQTAAAMLHRQQDAATLDSMITCIDHVIKLSPRNVYAHYNKGNACMLRGDYTSAISCYSKAIELKPDLGEAYYNRGLMYLRMGNKQPGVRDLSKAGELGVLPSYNVLKRMNR